MKNTFNKIIMITGLLAFSFSLLSQQTYINKDWVASTGSIGPIDRTVSVLDNNDNLITVSNTINALNNTDVLITKFDPEGNMLWQATFDGSGNGNDYGVQVKINSSNDIFVACQLEGTSSFDFGILKYSSSGSLTWSNSWNGSNNGDDIPSDLDIDNSGNVYVVGGTESSNTFSDYAMVKFNASGTFGWVSTYDYANLHDAATSVTFDNSKVNVTGASASSTTKWDYATLQLNASNGAVLNTERTVVTGVGFDKALDVTSDQNNNIYITGYVEGPGGFDIQTLKLNSNFGVEWIKIFDGGLEDIGNSIAVDNSGNVYVTGSMENGNGGKEYIILKYDLSGNLVWEQKYGAAGSEIIAIAEHLVLTSQGEPVITGTLDDLGEKLFATIKYTTDGALNFEKIFDAGSQENEAQSVISIDNEIYVTGVTKINGVNQITTVKYTIIDKPMNIVLVNGDPSHNQNELIIRFDESSILHTAIDKIDFEAGVLSDFIKPSVLSELSAATETSWNDYPTYKIFRRMTTADNVSVNRLGETIVIPDHWATLSVYVPVSNDLDALIGILDAIKPSIHYSEKNHFGELFSIPNDTKYTTEQSGLFSTVHGIQVEQAWDRQVGQSFIKIGVFDSGINWRHEDFGDGTSSGTKIAGGWDYYSNTSPFSQSTPDVNGHGTATSGIIGALRNNNKGIAGIAGGDVQDGNTGSKLFCMTLPVLGQYSHGTLNSIAAAAIVEGASDNPSTGYGYGLHVQNHSWGTTTYSKVLRDAVNTCYKNNCSFVVSSGNDYDNTVNYPATFNDSWVIKVGANDASGDRADFSTYGNILDFIAPGTNDIYTSLDHNNNSGYTYNGDGTSFSAPHVSGVTALLYSEHNPVTHYLYPNPLAPEDVEQLLEKNTDINSSSYNIYEGHGRVDANAAVEKASLPYRVRHFQQNVNTSNAVLFASNQTIQFPDGIPGLATSSYIGYTDVYKLTTTINHTIPSTENYVDGWVRNSSCELFSNTNTIANPHWAGVTMSSSNQNSTTLTGYIYKAHIYNYIGQYIGVRWFPTDLNSSVKFSYSIHTLDNNPNVGINELELNNSFSVYPNPANNQINVIYRLSEIEKVGYKIFDVTGRIVLSSNFGNQTQGEYNKLIDISTLTQGVYLIGLSIGDKVSSKRIIKN